MRLLEYQANEIGLYPGDSGEPSKVVKKGTGVTMFML